MNYPIYKKEKSFLFLLFVLQIVFLVLAVRFFLSDSLQVYDAPGHLQLVWNLKEHLWPSFWGWNSFSLLGFDQGVYYPPLFHYLAASLSFLFGIENSVKLIIFSAMLALPASLYFFVSKFFEDKKARIVSTSLLLLPLFIVPGYFGVGIKSLTQVGLLTSFVTTPLIFLYLGIIFSSKKANGWIETTLLSTIILTHFVAGLVCLLVLLVSLKLKFFERRLSFEDLRPLFFTALITCFFWLPLILRWNETSVSIHPSSLFWPNLAALALSLLLTATFWKRQKNFLLVISLSSAFLSFISLLDVFSVKYFLSNSFAEKIYNLHLYRYQIYNYLLLFLVVLYWPLRFLFSLKKPKIKPVWIASLPIIVLIFFAIFRPGLIVDRVEIGINKDNLAEGRFLEAFTREDSYPFVYSAQTNLVTEEKQSWAYGLFTDATTNGPYLGSLINTFSGKTPSGKDVQFTVEDNKVDLKRIGSVVDLFAVANLVYLSPKQPEANLGERFFTLNLSKKELVSTPTQELKFVNKNWDKEVADWWLKEDVLDSLLVKGKEVELSEESKIANKPEIVGHNKSWSNFVVETNSKEKIPVLIKFSHSPNWKAFGEDGSEIEIRTASPNLMLVFANGELTFKYQILWYQQIAFAVSLVSFAFWLFFYTGGKNVSKN